MKHKWFGMNDIKISSYDYLAIFCPGILLLFPLFIKIYTTTNDCQWLYILVLLFVSYFVGLAFHNLLELILKSIGLLKNEYLLWCTYQHVNNEKKENNDTEHTKENIRQIYDKQYYILMKQGMLGNIPILESQEAFIRNFGIVAVIYLVFHECYLIEIFSLCKCCACLICVSVILLSAILWYIEQRKVFISVWDAYKYCPPKVDDENNTENL